MGALGLLGLEIRMAKKNRKQRQARGRQQLRAKNGNGKMGSSLIDFGADTLKGIGRTLLPSMFKGQVQTMAQAPNNVGVVVPRSQFEAVGKAQSLADFDPGRSIRLRGNGKLWDYINRKPGSTGIFQEVPLVNPYRHYRGINVFSLDPRLFEIAKTYQYYAIRALRVTYIPVTGTTSAGAIGASIAFGISQDALEYIDLPTPNATQVLEQNISTMSPIWMPFTVSYEHDGTRVWNTDPTTPGPINQQSTQLLLVGAYSDGTVAAETYIGEMYVDYVVDLYEPQPAPQDGEYTAILPHFEDGNGFVYGTGVYDFTDNIPGEFYPDNYNPATNIVSVPPPEEEKLLEMAEFKVSSKVQPLLKPEFKFRPGKNVKRPSASETRIAELEERLGKLAVALDQNLPPQPPLLQRT